MLQVRFTDLNEFFDELLILRNKRLARNLKDPMIIRGGVKEEIISEGAATAHVVVQTVADFDGEKMIFEYLGSPSAPFPPEQREAQVAALQKQYAELKPQLDKEGLVRPGLFFA